MEMDLAREAVYDREGGEATTDVASVDGSATWPAIVGRRRS